MTTIKSVPDSWRSSFKVWDVVSYAWTEIGLDDKELSQYARKLRVQFKDWKQVRSIAIYDVAASFSIDSFLIFPCMIPGVMPDWCFDDSYLKQRMEKWYSRPRWIHFLNPVRLLGFPISLFMALKLIRRLRIEFESRSSIK